MKTLICAAICLGALVATVKGKSEESSCTFETGVCNWVNAYVDEWSWSSGDSSGSASKPPVDVTLGTAFGKYVYTELNSNLTSSPTFASPEIHSGTYCASFYFYTSSASAASLEVAILSATGARTQAKVVTNVLDGQWRQAFLDIHENDFFKFKLVALLNDPSANVVVAVDEFHLVKGHCHI